MVSLEFLGRREGRAQIRNADIEPDQARWPLALHQRTENIGLFPVFALERIGNRAGDQLSLERPPAVVFPEPACPVIELDVVGRLAEVIAPVLQRGRVLEDVVSLAVAGPQIERETVRDSAQTPRLTLRAACAYPCGHRGGNSAGNGGQGEPQRGCCHLPRRRCLDGHGKECGEPGQEADDSWRIPGRCASRPEVEAHHEAKVTP